MRKYSSMFGVLLTAAVLALSACSGDDGSDGPAGPPGEDGTNGATGATGPTGLNCWDLNGNGVADLATEDLNKDGKVDINDCRTPTGAYDPVALHKGYFTDNAYTGTSQCLNCHGKIGDDVMTTAHWKWEGVSSNIAGQEAGIHGKKDLINNFCQAVPSNEGRCTQCHIGIGWKDKTFDFGNPKNIDCLACHDQTGTYKKAPTTAGAPDPSVDLNKVAQSVAQNSGVPQRAACVFCHASAGGDDNVKHGDLALDMKTPPAFARRAHGHRRRGEVHLRLLPPGQEGPRRRHDLARHRRHGVPLGGRRRHEDVHRLPRLGCGHPCRYERRVDAAVAYQAGVPGVPHPGDREEDLDDDRLALGAGRPRDGACDLCAGRPERNAGSLHLLKMKGCFIWKNNVRPTLRYFDGKWNRMMINTNDRFTAGLPAVVDLASPTATYQTPGAMIYPFKKMTGNQPADKNTFTVLVPNLFGNATTDPDAYWVSFDWAKALASGSAYTGQSYSGEYVFVDTVMLLKVDHEVAPKEMAYGAVRRLPRRLADRLGGAGLCRRPDQRRGDSAEAVT